MGSYGTIACLSFHATKVVTTAEGGILLTDDEKIAEKAQRIRDQGMRRDKMYWCTEIGYNYRMTNLQAAIGVAQMEHIDEIVKRKEEQYNKYVQLFKDVPNISTLKTIPGVKRITCFFIVLVEPGYGKTRDETTAMLKQKGIGTRPVYYPFHSMPIYDSKEGDESFPIATPFAAAGIQIPYSLNLTDEEMKQVAEAFR